jgi:hypothetical protein
MSKPRYAKPAKEPTDKTPLEREESEFLSLALALYTVELKLSVRTLPECQMHARRMHNP